MPTLVNLLNIQAFQSKTFIKHSATYRQGIYMHVGMPKKPLMKYHPNSYRSRLPEPTMMMPYKNSSQIVFGDAQPSYKTMYRTTHGCFYSPHALGTAITNQGILSEASKWAHKRQWK